MFEGLFQPMHLLVIAGLALLIFGPKKLPELGKGLGESIRGFKKRDVVKRRRPNCEAVSEKQATNDKRLTTENRELRSASLC